MSTSAVNICSAALLQFGKAPINDFEQSSDTARLCASLYPMERDSMLRENDWNFAKKRQVLAPLAGAPAFGWSAQFALPSDFLCLISVGDNLIDSPRCMRFAIEGRSIMASGTALPITYIFRNEVEATWDSKAIELMTARMMWKLAYPVTQSTSLRDSLRDEYVQLARNARAIDAQENPGEALSDDYLFLNGRM